MLERAAFGATTIAGASLGGSITVATVPVTVTSAVSAGGLAGLLGFTTTVTTVVSAPVTVPVAGIVAAGALFGYGAYEAIKWRESIASKKLLQEIKDAIKNKFGSKALNQLWSEICQIIEIEKLKEILEAIKIVTTPEELRQTYAT
ncbi:MAG TPA: hypothetical protein V6D25_28885 [Leptolyngbyaceae cyanobacterium]